MKLLFIAALAFLCDSQPAVCQQKNLQTRLVKVSLQDSQVTDQILKFLGKNELPPLKIILPNKSYWFKGNRMHGPQTSAADTNRVHQVVVKSIHVKDGKAKLVTELDRKLKMITRFRSKGGCKGDYHWMILSRNIHTRRWWLKQGSYYFSSL